MYKLIIPRDIAPWKNKRYCRKRMVVITLRIFE